MKAPGVMNKNIGCFKKIFFLLLVITALVVIQAEGVQAQPVLPLPNLDIQMDTAEEPEEVVGTIRLLILLTVLAMAPAIILLMTSFTRVVIVLAFIRNALATQQTPPNQILVGLALFLTFFIMAPVYNQINEGAVQPYLEGQITQEQAMEIGADPIREFMYGQTREKDLALFLNIAQAERPQTREELGLHILIPAFVISELKTAFQLGFLIFIPFLIIDMVVASTTMSMGMFMLPPVMISLPFKILLFVLADGWHLVVKSLVESFL